MNNFKSKSFITLFNKWEAELPPSLIMRYSRREFIWSMAGLSVLTLGLPSLVTAQTTKDDDAGLTIEPWPTIIAVQRHLFPAGKNSPGADQINAPYYLQMMLNTPNFSQEEGNFILNGAKRVNAVSTEIYQRLFLNLTTKDKEEVLRFIETSPPGKIWLSALLMYIFEALLSDPIYGGNPQLIGWDWLEHQPGYPRPPENKKYWMLQ